MEESEIGEVGTDKLGDNVHEKAREEAARIPWLRWLALTTACFAVLAAIASLKSGSLANESLLKMNEATLRQAQASDEWSYYQAKGIKQVTREAQSDILAASHAPNSDVERTREEADRQKSEQQELQHKAKELEQERDKLQAESRNDLERHHRFAYAVTMLQVAIGLSAVAALVERKAVWLFAVLVGIAGAILFVIGFIR